MKKNNLKNILFIIIEIFLIFILYILFYDKSDVNLSSLKVLSFFSFCIVIFLLLKSFIVNKNIMSFYKIFLVFYSIYVFGIVFLRYVFDFEVYEITYYLDYTFGPNILYDGVLYSIITLISIDIGYSLFTLFNDSSNYKINNFTESKYPKSLKTIGFILFFMSIFFAFNQLYETMKLVLIYGYKGQIENVSYGLSSIGNQIVPFFIISIYILIIYYKDSKTKKNFFFILGLLYSLSLIFLGSRGIPLLNLLGLLIINMSLSKKINIKKIIKLTILLFIITILISVIRENRDTPLRNWGDNIFILVLEKVKSNPINESIYEMGLGIYPISYSMKLVPNTIPSMNGKTYIHAFTDNLVFNLSNKKMEKTNYNCGEIISEYEGYQFGSSFVEEIYCNFQWWGILFSLLIGYLIGWFSKKYLNSKNILIKILMFNFFIEFIWSIKNVLYNLPRLFLLYFISVLLLNMIINKNKAKKVNYE